MATILKAMVSIAGFVSLVWLTGCSTATAPLPQSTPASLEESQKTAPSITPSATDPTNPSPTATPAASPDASKLSPAASPATADRTVESCKVTMAKVEDPNPPANVRSQPDSKADNVVGTVKNGTFVTVEQMQEGWFRISTPVKGWIAKNITLSGCNQKTEQVRWTSGRTNFSIADQFIGTGSHVYRLQLTSGQTLTITGRKGPLPAIVAPDGVFLANMDDEKKSWVGAISKAGEYRIMLDSNFKGYKYNFEVEVK
ncbi:MAG: SH3 domain-containing protein [Synechococcales bacterium]|nr:SH3 domain-containing protein [Synechococcales bacterium]